MYAVILCGGSGTRLWPLSRKNFPKQFLRLYSDKSLLQETFVRMSGAVPRDNIFLVTNEENYFNVFNQLREIYPKIKKDRIIIEPASLNTAPAIMLAVKYLTDVIGIKPDDPIIEVHSDHYIGKVEQYLQVVQNAFARVKDSIGIIGIVPTRADTGYGYIKKGLEKKGFWTVDSFKEKPDAAVAEQFFKSGQYLWNAGMYIFSAQTFAEQLEKHAQSLAQAYRADFESFLKHFSDLPSMAIEHAITEKSREVIMFAGDFDWSDIGSFDVLADIAAKDDQVNTRHIAFDSKGVYTHSDNGRLIATIGVDDVVVVESNEVILVQKKGRSEDVKKVVEHLKKNNYKEVEHNIVVYRPWGKYEVLIDEANHKVKKITVFAGASLSLQSHNHRAEHWVVVKGIAKVVNGENLLTLHENESTYIPAKAKHRLSNPGKTDLEIIEVQTGKYLEEDDIVRYDDQYERR